MYKIGKLNEDDILNQASSTNQERNKAKDSDDDQEYDNKDTDNLTDYKDPTTKVKVSWPARKAAVPCLPPTLIAIDKWSE